MKKQLLIVTLSMLFSAFCFGQALNLPVDFENTTPNYYALTDFGGNASEIIVDPTNPTNHVVKTIKTATAELWAGTTVGGTVGFATPIPFVPGSTIMRVRVWSPTAGTPVRLKVEASNDPTISVETETLTAVASAWDTLVFNFSNQAAGTAAINFANSYNKASIFFNFGTTGALAGERTYYWDDMEFYQGAPTPALNLPVTFEDVTLNYGLTDFGVAKTIKTATAELWAGTTVGGTVGFSNPIPFAAGSTKMSVRVWSPTAGTPIRLKVEASNNPTISVETEANTTVASAWQILVFDFSNQAPGTAAINFANSYNKASIFFNFGTTGAQAGEQTYYWDDMYFGIYTSVNNLNASENNVSVYPNPAENDLYIRSDATISKVAIYNILGSQVKEFGNVLQSINVSDLKTGVYHIKITDTKGKTATSVFVKK
ncbi:MAG: T9SS type A sorting domain-containing protein [Bacteroidetes bacterium]|nr:T9SS type A sorting domain-containing protein [Bacteroidota bacterium]